MWGLNSLFCPIVIHLSSYITLQSAHYDFSYNLFPCSTIPDCLDPTKVEGCIFYGPSPGPTPTPIVTYTLRDVLTQFYYATNGEHWLDNDGWLGAKDPCPLGLNPSLFELNFYSSSLFLSLLTPYFTENRGMGWCVLE